MKSKRIYIFLFVIIMGIMIVSQAQSLLANYNIVEDMSIQTSVNSLKEGEIVAITVTDSNVEDTKLVIPIDKTMEYVESDHLDGSVVFDTINNQLVIDWMDSSNEQKAVTVMLKMNKEGLYPLKALTVRDNQEVNTKEVSIDVVGAEESQTENVDIESSTSFEQSILDKVIAEDPTLENFDRDYEEITGIWGTAPWRYDVSTGVLTIESGAVNISQKPWSSISGPLKDSIIKKLVFTGPVILPRDSTYLFTEQHRRALDTVETIEGLNYVDTSSVTKMKAMFRGMRSLKILDLSSFNTSNVTDMESMFEGMESLESLDLSSFNTAKVRTMTKMFKGLEKLTNLDLSSFDTPSLGSLEYMFEGSEKIKELDISTFDTTNVATFGGFFRGISLRKLTLGEKSLIGNEKGVGNGLGSPLPLDENEVSGNWVKENGESKAYSPREFGQKYGRIEDLTAGTYVAETIPTGEISGEIKLENQTSLDGLFYVNDEIKFQNKIHHKGEVWNYLYKTIIPDELTINKESFKGYRITEDGNMVDFPKEVFKFDESSRMLEVNLKAISEVDGKGNYYSFGERNFYYEFTAITNKEAIGKKIKLDSTISYFDKIFNPYQDVELSVESKEIYGLEPEWELEKKIKNTSRSDEITAVGDELEFTLTATNKEELGAMKSFAIAETMFPNELDFIRGSAELILPNGDTKKLDDSVYQPEKQLVSTNVFSENGFVGVKPYSLRFKAKIKDLAYGKILETKANLNGLTQIGNVVTIDDNKVEINVAYSGKLGFKETPKTLSFKDSFISAFTSTIERKDADWGISIEDTRAQKQPWTLSVKQASPFESIDGDALTQVLIFRKNGIEDKAIDVENEVDVYSEGSPNLNDYFVSWQKDEGFFLKVPPGTAKAKQYQTELQWNLKDTPI
ncbi:BspA family leucine-rich repeat surface protein [Carnobacterium divergens]|uniref:BspA family leucine-rich repeat surface protein n=1 Tax=Carnobacterium divergens TaxID=2748 RepID=A0AAW8R7U7_CARDV|nr:BspA family leucine-rich repeat surface protein [Carnobacterium divergens]MDT1956992.1 BspA family leucine-rich repeat surface protein [Carnobacterium divergens]MDT1972962.1 BspA family leucine-rich repeat surface protein [Carnobacterium divergens]